MIVTLRGGRFDLDTAEVADLRRQLAIPDAEIDAEVAAREERADEEALIGTAEAARRIGMSAEFVRDHAKELGGRKVVDGRRGRWLFDPADLGRPHEPERVEPAPPTPRRRRRPPASSSVELLPVRGECP